MWKLKTYEDQAKFSLMLSGVSGLALLAAVAMVLQNFDWDNYYFVYSSKGLRLYAVLLAILTALATGGLGFMLGLHTAGQRRNKQTNLSWIAFFACATTITLTMCVAIFMWKTKLATG